MVGASVEGEIDPGIFQEIGGGQVGLARHKPDRGLRARLLESHRSADDLSLRGDADELTEFEILKEFSKLYDLFVHC